MSRLHKVTWQPLMQPHGVLMGRMIVGEAPWKNITVAFSHKKTICEVQILKKNENVLQRKYWPWITLKQYFINKTWEKLYMSYQGWTIILSKLDKTFWKWILLSRVCDTLLSALKYVIFVRSKASGNVIFPGWNFLTYPTQHFDLSGPSFHTNLILIHYNSFWDRTNMAFKDLFKAEKTQKN